MKYEIRYKVLDTYGDFIQGGRMFYADTDEQFDVDDINGDAKAAAKICAEDFFHYHDGQYQDWPLTIILLNSDNEEASRHEVDVCQTPRFSVTSSAIGTE